MVDCRHQLARNGHTLYMVRLFAAVGLTLFFFPSHAQSSLTLQVLVRWEQEQQNTSLSSRDSLLEWLTHCETHPLPLNEIPLGQLLDWCFLRPSEAVALAFYRDKGGSLMSWNELHFVRPLDSLSKKALKTYCTLQKTPYPTFWHATTRWTAQIPWTWGVSTRISGKKWSITAGRSPSAGQWRSTVRVGRWSANGTYAPSKGINLRIGFQHLWPAGKGSWYGGYSAQGFHFQHKGSYTLRENQSLRWHFQKEPAPLWGQNLLGELEFTKRWSAVGGESTLHLQWTHSEWSSPSGQWRYMHSLRQQNVTWRSTLSAESSGLWRFSLRASTPGGRLTYYDAWTARGRSRVLEALVQVPLLPKGRLECHTAVVHGMGYAPVVYGVQPYGKKQWILGNHLTWNTRKLRCSLGIQCSPGQIIPTGRIQIVFDRQPIATKNSDNF